MTINLICTKPEPLCKCCQSEGMYLYRNLKDRLFGVKGEWHLKKCNNINCGLVWLDPMPVEEDIGIAYETYYTHQNSPTQKNTFLRNVYLSVKQGYLYSKYGYYEDIPLVYSLLGLLLYLHPGRRAAVDFEVFYTQAMSDGRLLEIGCGSGEMLKSMQERGWKVEGLDFDEQAVMNARSKGLDVKLGALQEQNYTDNTFDAVVMSHVIEHVPDPEKIIAECKRILKPNGSLIMITPNINSWGHSIYKENWRGLEPPRHLHLFNRNSINALLYKVGFSETRVTTTIRDANGMFAASRALKTSCVGEAVSKFNRIWTLGMQVFEWLLLKFNIDIGEEIVIKARK